jgi:hypothetical protein
VKLVLRITPLSNNLDIETQPSRRATFSALISWRLAERLSRVIETIERQMQP